MGETLKYKLPYPTLASIPNVPADLQALAIAVEAGLNTARTQQLNQTQFDVNTSISAYPLDVSLMAVDSANAIRGRWPFAIPCFIITLASVSPVTGTTPNRGTQLWTSSLHASDESQPNGLYMRSFTTAGSWDPWWRVGPPLTGYLDFATVANTNRSATIKFPSYSFLRAPTITASIDDVNPSRCSVSAGRPMDTLGFTLYVHRTETVTTRAFWMASDQYGMVIALREGAEQQVAEEPPSVEATFTHPGQNCPEAALDPHILRIPADQTDWGGATCAVCSSSLVRQS